jgi:hypothetical protein
MDEQLLFVHSSNRCLHADAQLWVDKWKPKVAADLVGNQQGQTVIRQFLQDWERVHLHNEAPRAAPGAANQRKDMSKKALLISGPPGTGKTTSSQIISKYDNLAATFAISARKTRFRSVKFGPFFPNTRDANRYTAVHTYHCSPPTVACFC